VPVPSSDESDSAAFTGISPPQSIEPALEIVRHATETVIRVQRCIQRIEGTVLRLRIRCGDLGASEQHRT